MLSSYLLSEDKVGVSPSTTTMWVPYASTPELRSGNLGVICERDAWFTGTAQGMPATIAMKIDNSKGLGMTTNEIVRTISGLGEVPSDDDLARQYGYTPVRIGWINGRNVKTGKPYYSQAGAAASTGLGADPVLNVDAAATPVDSQKYLDESLKLQKRQALLQGISTAAIVGLAVSSLIGFICRSK
jgi:hypothetical protein